MIGLNESLCTWNNNNSMHSIEASKTSMKKWKIINHMINLLLSIDLIYPLRMQLAII